MKNMIIFRACVRGKERDRYIIFFLILKVDEGILPIVENLLNIFSVIEIFRGIFFVKEGTLFLVFAVTSKNMPCHPLNKQTNKCRGTFCSKSKPCGNFAGYFGKKHHKPNIYEFRLTFEV